MEILINNELANFDITPYEELIIAALKRAASLENLANPWSVSVSFVEKAAIRKLNQSYRNCDSATDVLSFPQGDDQFCFLPGMPIILGDIVISLERAIEQAEEYGHGTQREVVFLAVHGFFHLLGYDHQNAKEQIVMREKEERVLKELDLGRD